MKEKQNFWYVVWRNSYESYNIKQGDGYFVGYKDKLSDKFSKNALESKKYNTIGAAINRLGLKLNIISVEDFWKKNPKTEKWQREQKLNDILDKDISYENIFGQGRIERLYLDGHTECAYDDVMEYIENLIMKNNKELDKKRKKYMNLTKSSNIIEHDPNEDFWN